MDHNSVKGITGLTMFAFDIDSVGAVQIMFTTKKKVFISPYLAESSSGNKSS